MEAVLTMLGGEVADTIKGGYSFEHTAREHRCNFGLVTVSHRLFFFFNTLEPRVECYKSL